MDQFKIDDQKISFFPYIVGKRLNYSNSWEILKKIYPIYMEVSPSGACNHRCVFCALDYLSYKKSFLDIDKYIEFIKIASVKGVRSIMFGGEGEPLMHPRIIDMVIKTKEYSIDSAITTNGSLMTPSFLDNCMGHLNWIKVSLDAATSDTHALIHRTNRNDFDKIVTNIEYAVHLKQRMNYKCSIGVQLLLLKENVNEALKLARIAKDIGVDYFVVKPYSQGLFSNNIIDIDYSNLLSADDIENGINKLSDDKFSAVFRKNAFLTAIEKVEKYQKCLAVPFFWSYITTEGDVYSCSAFIGNSDFMLGNICDSSFELIWEGETRKNNWLMIKDMSIRECRENCRMDKVNIYLDSLTKPPPNYTFI